MNARFCSLGRLLPDLFYFTILFILLWCWKPAVGQSAATVPIIGQKVPDVDLGQVLRFKDGKAKLSDFQGKLLILDFWATWCKPCVMMIPRMDSLEKQFEGKVQFLPVSYQTAEQIAVFRQKLARRNGMRIQGPEVVGDTLLKLLFPHSGVPHYVWIDQEGVLRAVTGLEEITAAKIQQVLSSLSAFLPEKKDEPRLSYDPHTTPLFEFIGQQKLPAFGEVNYHALLTGYIPGMQSRTSFLKPRVKGQNWRLTYCNENLRSMYGYAYGRARRFFSDNSISIEVRDSSQFFHMGKTAREWMPQHSYCYELVVPAQLADSGFAMVQKDLRRLFPQYEARVEKRKMKVLALVRTSASDKIKSRSEQRKVSYDGFSYQAQRTTMENFLVGLNGIYMNSSPMPIADHTGYQGEIDLALDVKFSDLEDVNRGLSRYDLRLIETVDSVEILVIKDRVRMDTSAEN
ncbi:soil-associated protein, TIGR03435 family [Dyadobacter koreensis]|uniref:Soil-associated protein, TIGR03435 family n=1 Tax=Dyadobacter koreensis TaxID=408657 RepID=A0A1H6QZ68_9BACT|nr:TlpA disulfide reductase family protein [Dyadobacter koreensis]SEI46284.1 soil-associated protein, TIGR03435 family [Dyadobacter koreensis]